MTWKMPLAKIDWFPIEAGHIKLFARAIGDPNPVYTDPVYACSIGFDGVIAPPTFLEAGIHFDDAFPYRPRLGEPWLGSAAEPSGLPPEALHAGTDMHAETHYEYHRTIRPGMVLHVDARRGRSWDAEGKRAGRLHFADTINDYLDEDGTLVASCRTVVVSTEKKVEQPARIERDRPALRLLDLPASYPAAITPVVGARREAVVASNLTRAQIIQYSGASGDFSPQHADEIYNTRVAGYPSVFAHGMLTMAMTGRMLTDWIGDDRLTKFGFQFRQQLWPGDSVIASATIVSIGEGPAALADVDLETRNQHGDLLGKGYAVARLG